MKSILRVLGALATACVLSILLLTTIAWAADPAVELQAAALAVIAAPNSWLAWGGVIVAGASLICSATPTPGRDSKLYYPYKALELVAFIFGKAKEVGPPRSFSAIAVLIGVGLALSACAVQQKLDAAIATPGAQQGFVLTCAGAKLVIGQATRLALPAATAAGVAEANSLITEACEGGAPSGAADLEARLAKIVLEDQYVRAVIAKAVGG